jgi:hypothetical protein
MSRHSVGWPVLTRAQCVDLPVPGGVLPVAPALAPIFADLARQYHATVEPLQWPGCWGWADRESKHRYGTAIDLDAPKHPQGVPAARTFTRPQITAVGRILARYDGLIVWGGTWDLPDTDGMHFELRDGATFAQVAAVARTLDQHAPPAPARPPTPAKHAAAHDLTGTGTSLRGDEGDSGPRVRAWQHWLNHYAPAYSDLLEDGRWGPRTSAVNATFARRSGIAADGRNIGPRLAAAYWRAGLFRPLSPARVRAAGHITRAARR